MLTDTPDIEAIRARRNEGYLVNEPGVSKGLMDVTSMKADISALLDEVEKLRGELASLHEKHREKHAGYRTGPDGTMVKLWGDDMGGDALALNEASMKKWKRNHP